MIRKYVEPGIERIKRTLLFEQVQPRPLIDDSWFDDGYEFTHAVGFETFDFDDFDDDLEEEEEDSNTESLL